jgi:hypothetical protein
MKGLLGKFHSTVQPIARSFSASPPPPLPTWSEIYKREQAIMQEPHYADFDFQIIARQNRCMTEIMNPAGDLAFKRC